MNAPEVRTRLLADPSLWCAEVCDAATRTTIWDSWRDEWAAYPTAEEAAARARDVIRRL